MGHDATPRLAWAITGSGHDLRGCLALAASVAPVDLFLSRAAEEVVRIYGYDLEPFRRTGRLFRDGAASAPPVGRFYTGQYHTLVIAPATSNTVAKAVCGISDTLVTNLYAQAGKCRVPSLVYACDSAPELETEAPDGPVTVRPRRIDLENAERLAGFEFTEVVGSLERLAAALDRRLTCPSASSF